MLLFHRNGTCATLPFILSTWLILLNVTRCVIPGSTINSKWKVIGCPGFPRIWGVNVTKGTPTHAQTCKYKNRPVRLRAPALEEPPLFEWVLKLLYSSVRATWKSAAIKNLGILTKFAAAIEPVIDIAGLRRSGSCGRVSACKRLSAEQTIYSLTHPCFSQWSASWILKTLNTSTYGCCQNAAVSMLMYLRSKSRIWIYVAMNCSCERIQFQTRARYGCWFRNGTAPLVTLTYANVQGSSETEAKQPTTQLLRAKLHLI